MHNQAFNKSPLNKPFLRVGAEIKWFRNQSGAGYLCCKGSAGGNANFLQPLKQTLFRVFTLGRLGLRVSWKYWGGGDKYPRTNTILRQHTRPGLPGSGARVAGIGQQGRCAKPGITVVRGLPRPTLAPGPRGCGLTHGLSPLRHVGLGPSALELAGYWSRESRGRPRPRDFGPKALPRLSEERVRSEYT